MKTETCQPRIDRLRVNDVMHRGVFMCEQEARLSEVAATMAREHVHCVVVESDRGEGRASLGDRVRPGPSGGVHSPRSR